MKKILNTYFKLVDNRSGIAVKEFTVLLDAFNHIRNTINDAREWSVEEKSLDNGKFICGISAFYLVEHFKNGVGLPESIQDIEMKRETRQFEIELKEEILSDDHAIYGDFLYVCDGKVVRSDLMSGTVADLKRDLRGHYKLEAKVITSCDIEGRKKLLTKTNGW